ncbi:MAG: endonuclease domain-containing protein [Ruminococcaceae bacterium]|nr:endonuclease domain-containing protein [Oscillospiraceae bacterium]
MNEISNPKLTGLSKTLRKNMTKEERHLWYDFLKNLPVTVNRQKVVGDYIVDFYCSSAKVVIELDGSQHFDIKGEAKDIIRDEFLKGLGLTVLRYSNLEVKTNFNGVCEDIWNHIRTSPPPTAEPPLKGKP